MSRLGIFNLNGTDYDLDDLTLDEMSEIEEHAGAVMSDINYGAAKSMKAVAYVLLKRDNLEVTWEEVGKVKVLGFMPAEEEMPALPPGESDEMETPQNGSDLVASGIRGSVASTTG